MQNIKQNCIRLQKTNLDEKIILCLVVTRFPKKNMDRRNKRRTQDYSLAKCIYQLHLISKQSLF